MIEDYNYKEITLDKINRIEIFYYSIGENLNVMMEIINIITVGKNQKKKNKCNYLILTKKFI